MVWLFIVAVVAFVGFKFFSSLQKDNDDLQSRTLSDKFQTIVNAINDVAFNGQGKVTTLDKREFNLYKEGDNQIIKFQYSTGILSIIWKYKYFQKEVVHERQFDNARNLSIFEQDKIAQVLIKEMNAVVAKHKTDVIAPVEAEILNLIQEPDFINSTIKEDSIENITINSSTAFDVILTFGSDYITSNYASYSGQITYPGMGLSFHYKLEDTESKIFTIEVEYPFSGHTLDSFKLGQTTLGDIIAKYGEPESMPVMDRNIYYKVNKVHYGIKFNIEDTSKEGYDYESNLNKKISHIKLI